MSAKTEQLLISDVKNSQHRHHHSEENDKISKDEAAVYDRQIRLWGIEAQNKLRKSSVLVCGISQCGSEFVKNITLAGVQRLVLMDDKSITEDDIGHNFLLRLDEKNLLGTNRARAAFSRTGELNPNVKLSYLENSLEEHLNSLDEEAGERFLSEFSLVAIFDHEYDTIVKLNNLCRKLNIRFVAGGVFGWIGYAFHDFNDKMFLMRVETEFPTINLEGNSSTQQNVVTIEEEQFHPKKLSYPSFFDAFNFTPSTKAQKRRASRIPGAFYLLKAIFRAQKEKQFNGNEEHDLAVLEKNWNEELVAFNQSKETQSVQPDKFDHLFNPQFTPACAMVGGIMGQEVIKSLSEGKKPLPNVFIYCGIDSSCIMSALPPK
ncbi:unnamed protein product [Caenorhabditis bovis]|uniref:SUMO-activating enzyme subunit 1 n=1 Tax=Caenorhabditis bovis TaxID=2654633 RepID=A0A8S1EF52_9PELO|nr:unnamed protein product [Caenorhabditis bovis]